MTRASLCSALCVVVAVSLSLRSACAQPAAGDTSRPSLPGLHHEAVAFDAARGRLVVFGGTDSLRGTWEWDGSRWRLSVDSAASPPPRFGSTLGYDPERRRLVLFGGWDQTPTRRPPFPLRCETWAYDGRSWSEVNAGPCVTDRVRDNSLIYDTRRQSMLLLDGTPEQEASTVRSLRVWRWSRDAWMLVDSTGPRRGGWDQAAYDDARSVVVIPVFDGPDAGVWEWDGERWRHVVPTEPAPSPRHVYAFAYDPRGRRLVLVGGQTYTRPSRYLGDAWTWDGTRWSELAPVTQVAPGARAGATLTYDARNERFLYFGGYAGPPVRYFPELWILDRKGWRLWQP